MNQIALPATADQVLPARAGSGLRHLLARCWAESRALTIAGTLMLLWLLPTWLLSVLQPQVVNGIDAYLKPMKFQLSVGLYLLCLAWLRSYVDAAGRQRRLAIWTSAVPIVTGYGEVLYILWRATQGEGSHFNTGTPAASMAYALMGVGALLLVWAAGALAILLHRHARRDVNAAWLASLRWGLWLTLILGGLAGIYLSAQPGHAVGGLGNDAGGLPLIGWSRSGGDLRVAHFLGIHAMQFLPLAGWWMARRWPERQALRGVHAFAAAYVVLTALTLVQAIAGLPLLFGL
jgi:hypothetical protein